MSKLHWLLGLGLIYIGCAVMTAKEAVYLKQAEGQATQSDVRQRLGAPRHIMEQADGGAMWVYEVREVEPGGQNSWVATGSWCDEYRLSFDKGGVLRRWTHNSYLHGGETQPINCDPALGSHRPAL